MTEHHPNSDQSGFTQSAGRGNILSFPDEVSRTPRATPIPQNQPHSHPQANFSLKPERLLVMNRHVVDGIFGKRHWAREWVLGLCEADPLFLLHLADQSRGYVHFLCLVKLALLQQPEKDESLTCATFFRTHSKKNILHSIFPSCPKGILGVLPKLQKKPMTGEGYERLLTLLADSGMRKILLHKKSVRQKNLTLLELCKNLPEEFKTGKVTDCVTKYDDYAYLVMIARIVNQFDIKINKEEIDQTMKEEIKETLGYRKLRIAESLGSFISRKIEGRPFPEPPWPGTERVRPVCSKKELREVGREFENCAGQYLGKILFGYSYFYVCKQPHAVIEVKKDMALGWSIGDMEGVSHRKFSLEERQRIIGEFSDSDFFLRPSPSGLYMGENLCYIFD